LLRDFLAFDSSFMGGVFVAGGDLNRDGYADIVVGADAGGAPQVKAFSGAGGATLLDFLAYDAQFSGGGRVAVGDVNGDGFNEIVTGSGLGAPAEVKVFRGSVAVQDYFVYGSNYLGGVFVAVGDLDGDGRAEVLTGRGQDFSEVKIFSGAG